MENTANIAIQMADKVKLNVWLFSFLCLDNLNNSTYSTIMFYTNYDMLHIYPFYIFSKHRIFLNNLDRLNGER